MIGARHYVYLISNRDNGKRYVGRSSRANRWGEHKHSARGGSVYAIHRAIRKYGESAFSFEVIQWCDSAEDAANAEIFWIEWCNSFGPDGYNMTSGGEGGSGYRHTPEALAAISRAHTGKKLAPEQIAFLREIHTGTTHTSETRAKMAVSQQRRRATTPITDDFRSKMSAIAKERRRINPHPPTSPETRQRMAEAQAKRRQREKQLKEGLV